VIRVGGPIMALSNVTAAHDPTDKTSLPTDGEKRGRESLCILRVEVGKEEAGGGAGEGGAELGGVGGLAAGGEVEGVVLEAGVDVEEGGPVGGEGGAGEADPVAVEGFDPAVAVACGSALEGGFAIAAEVFDEGVEAFEGIAGGLGLKGGEVFPLFGVVAVEVGGVGGFFIGGGGFDEELAGFAGFPGIAEEALSAGAFAAEAADGDVVALKEDFGAAVRGDGAGVVLVAGVPDGEDDDFVIGAGEFLDAEIAVVEAGGAEVGSRVGFIDGDFVVEKCCGWGGIPEVNGASGAGLGGW